MNCKNCIKYDVCSNSYSMLYPNDTTYENMKACDDFKIRKEIKIEKINKIIIPITTNTIQRRLEAI